MIRTNRTDSWQRAWTARAGAAETKGTNAAESLEAEGEDSPAGRRSNSYLALALIAAVAIQRPLQLLARNLDGGVSLGKLALHVAIVIALGLGVFYLGRRLGLGRLVAGLTAAMLCLTGLNWEGGLVMGVVALVLVPVAVLVAIRLENSFLPAVMVIAVAAIGAAPVVQVVAGVLDRGEVHIAEVAPVTAAVSGRAEDVIVVILDEYAGLATLDADFGYDGMDFVHRLESDGLTVPAVAWSTGASTFVSVSEMLEMGPLVPDGVLLSSADDGELYRRMGGDNRFVSALRQGGYHYTHIESGWEGTRCGEPVDTCVEAPWIDPTVWSLWHPSAIGGWLEDEVAHPFIHAGLRGAERLVDLLAEYSSNDRRDMVIAHILLPHGPFVLTPDCTVRPGVDVDEPPATLGERGSRYLEQIACVESIVQRVADNTSDDAVLAISSDHGTFVDGDSQLPTGEWSDRTIAQRLNVFMAYRFPEGCRNPDSAVTTALTAAAMACALDVGRIDTSPRFTLALNSPQVEREPVIRLSEERMTDVVAVYGG